MGFFENFIEFIEQENKIFVESPTESPMTGSALAVKAFEIALRELGLGEEGSNNKGPAVLKYRRGHDTTGAWCAAFISWCFEEAAIELGLTLEWKRSNGAKRLFKNLKRYGITVDWKDTGNLLPGDVICWNRGKEGSWKGHIGIIFKIEDGLVSVVEGNVGKFPAKVKIFKHDLSYERVYGVVRV